MNYSMDLCWVAATIERAAPAAKQPADTPLDDAIAPALQRLRQSLQEFPGQPVTPQATWELERQVLDLLREVGRAGIEWAFNRVEPDRRLAIARQVRGQRLRAGTSRC